jgi:hypothetical protein
LRTHTRNQVGTGERREVKGWRVAGGAEHRPERTESFAAAVHLGYGSQHLRLNRLIVTRTRSLYGATLVIGRRGEYEHATTCLVRE